MKMPRNADKLSQAFGWASVVIAALLTSPIIGFFWINIDSEPNEIASRELILIQRLNLLVTVCCFLIVYRLLSRYAYRIVLTAVAGSILSTVLCIAIVQVGTGFLIKPFRLLHFWTALAISLGVSLLVSSGSMLAGKGLVLMVVWLKARFLGKTVRNDSDN